jgi:hypothetical protein
MDMQYDGDFWVQCAGCNCSTQVFDSEAESHKAWDTRAQPSDGALTNEGAEPVAWQIRAICSDGTRMGWRDVSKARFQEATSSAILSASAGGHVDWECRQLYSNPPAPTSAPPPKVCTCPSGDGSLRWPCPVHPPEVKALVLPERMPVPDADCPERTNAQGWNACLDRVKELNS